MKVTEFASMFMERIMRRPPLLCIPRQFWKASLTREYGGMVTMVMSKFCTFTVVRVTSCTTPLTP